MPELYLNVVLFALVLFGFILGWTSVFALTNPSEYIRWLTPLYWISRKICKHNLKRLDKVLAGISIFFSMGLLLTINFALGGWFVTILLQLWSSPYQRIWGY